MPSLEGRSSEGNAAGGLAEPLRAPNMCLSRATCRAVDDVLALLASRQL